MAKTTSKGVYIAALVLFLGGFGYLVYSGLSEDSVYFLNVSEALAMEQSELGQARLFGKVADGDVVMARGNLGVAFTLVDKTDPGQSLRVDYTGAVPDTFEPGVEVIVEGAWRPGENVFAANTLITKCPSKYESMSQELDEQAQGG